MCKCQGSTGGKSSHCRGNKDRKILLPSSNSQLTKDSPNCSDLSHLYWLRLQLWSPAVSQFSFHLCSGKKLFVGAEEKGCSLKIKFTAQRKLQLSLSLINFNPCENRNAQRCLHFACIPWICITSLSRGGTSYIKKSVQDLSVCQPLRITCLTMGSHLAIRAK